MAFNQEHIVGEHVEVEEFDLGASQPVIINLMRDVPRHAESLALRVKKLRELIDSCSQLKEVLTRVYKTPSNSYNPPVGVAVDSTFPPEGGVDMVSGSLVGVVAGYLVYHGAERLNGIEKLGLYARLRIVDKQDEASREAAELSKILERVIILRKLLPRLPEGSVLLIDGEVVPYVLVFTKASKGLRPKLDEITSLMLKEAERRRVLLVGVVKRSYTFLYSVFAQGCIDGRLPVNDKTVASLVLKPGEYTILGSFSELASKYAFIMVSRNPSLAAKVVESRLEKRPEYGDVVVGFYKPRVVPLAWQAVKIEVYAPWLSREEAFNVVVSHLDSLTNRSTGLPYPIDLIDEYVRLEARALEVVRQRLLRVLAEKLVEHGIPEEQAVLLTLHTNPEKRYLYQPRLRH